MYLIEMTDFQLSDLAAFLLELARGTSLNTWAHVNLMTVQKAKVNIDCLTHMYGK